MTKLLKVNLEVFWDSIFRFVYDPENKELKVNWDFIHDLIQIIGSDEFHVYKVEITIYFEAWLYSTYSSNAKKDITDLNELVTDSFFVFIKLILKKYIESPDFNSFASEDEIEIFVNLLRSVKENVRISLGFLKGNSALDEVSKLDERLTQLLNNQKDDFEKKLNDMNKHAVEQMTSMVSDAKKKTNDVYRGVQSKLESQSQKTAEQSITILGIFVGVVMVFFGGFSILEGTIQGMTKATPYRLYFTMLAYGGIMYNIVVLMFFLISRIIEKPITCSCHSFREDDSSVDDARSKADRTVQKTSDEDNNGTVDHEKKPDKKSKTVIVRSRSSDTVNCKKCISALRNRRNICRIRHTLPYVYWGNVFIIAGLGFIFGLKCYSNEDSPLRIELLQFVRAITIPFFVMSLGNMLGYAIKKDRKSPNNEKSTNN